MARAIVSCRHTCCAGGGLPVTYYGTSGIERQQRPVNWRKFIRHLDRCQRACWYSRSGNDVKLIRSIPRSKKLLKMPLKAIQERVIMDPETGKVPWLHRPPMMLLTWNRCSLDQQGRDLPTRCIPRHARAGAPGSTFKMVDHCQRAAKTTLLITYKSPGTMDIGNAPITNLMWV